MGKTQPPAQGQTVTSLLEAQVKRTPGAVAIVHDGRRVTYAQLDSMANRRANWLVAHGFGPERFCGIVMDHGPEQIATILAAIKAGGAYIPIEPTFPRGRINSILRQAEVACVFTQHRHASLFEGAELLIFEDEGFSRFPSMPPVRRPEGTNALYALFTSGTTGEPKGVVVEHHNVWNYILAFQNEFAPRPSDRMLQNSVCTFDIFVEEVFPILASGGTLVIPTPEEQSCAEALVDFCDREGVTMLSGFPYLLSDINKLRVPKGLRVAISGGDTLRKEHVDNLVGKVDVYNTYGPTETTVVCTYYHYADPEIPTRTVPVGSSILGCTLRVLDRQGHPVRPGEMGQLCITGNGVARGYLGNPEETAARFVESPFGDGRMYLSGDLGRLSADGTVEFVRRADDQTMIDGRRVEPAEVESVMYRYPGVAEAVVVPWLDDDEYPYLVAYLTCSKPVIMSRLRGFLERYLPDYMIPDSFRQLAAMPLTDNGKIDRGSLPKVERRGAQGRR
jgi:amino acid adenylation domain-containing protein